MRGPRRSPALDPAPVGLERDVEDPDVPHARHAVGQEEEREELALPEGGGRRVVDVEVDEPGQEEAPGVAVRRARSAARLRTGRRVRVEGDDAIAFDAERDARAPRAARLDQHEAREREPLRRHAGVRRREGSTRGARRPRRAPPRARPPRAPPGAVERASPGPSLRGGAQEARAPEAARPEGADPEAGGEAEDVAARRVHGATLPDRPAGRRLRRPLDVGHARLTNVS